MDTYKDDENGENSDNMEKYLEKKKKK